MTRLLTMLSVMILGIWMLALFSDMPPSGIKIVHVIMFVVGIIGLLNGWSLHGGSSGDFFFTAAIFIGFLWGSSSLIGQPIWIPFVVFGGILLATWGVYLGWAYFFYRHKRGADGIFIDVNGDIVLTERAGMTEYEISMEARRLAKQD